jgi:hypothetical protein
MISTFINGFVFWNVAKTVNIPVIEEGLPPMSQPYLVEGEHWVLIAEQG